MNAIEMKPPAGPATEAQHERERWDRVLDRELSRPMGEWPPIVVAIAGRMRLRVSVGGAR